MFLSLAAAGWSGYAEHVERSIDLTDLLKRRAVARGWSIANSSPLAVLCIKPPPGVGDVRSIVARVLASGRAWIAVASFESSDVIRACITHGETTSEDVLELVQVLTFGDETKAGLHATGA